MSDLAGDIYLSQSALSRAVARLELEGLVERSMCDDDRRAVFVRLTEEGKRLHERALPTHRAVLSETWATDKES
jgi:DNA-binding MarR family transcriptional regulator